jgi:hypothetical protein
MHRSLERLRCPRLSRTLHRRQQFWLLVKVSQLRFHFWYRLHANETLQPPVSMQSMTDAMPSALPSET